MLNIDLIQEFDFIIVGTGAGGAVVGKELAEAGKSVLFIEKGEWLSDQDRSLTASEAVRKLYVDAGFTWAIGNSLMALPHGCTVGGTTTINSATCFRAPKEVHDRWVTEFGLKNLALEKFTQHYEAIEKRIHVAPCMVETMNSSNQFIRNIALKDGLRGAALNRNALSCDGCGMCCYACTGNKKQSVDVNYMPDAINHGAKLNIKTTLKRILLRDNKVYGVQVVNNNCSANNRKTEIYYCKNLIISAGTYATPLLLKSSKIRPSKQLGRNLTVHPASKVYAEFDEDQYSWNGVPQAYSLSNLQAEGILFEGVFMPPEIAASMNPFVGKKLNHFMRNYSKVMSFGFLIEDSGSGRVTHLPLLGRAILYSLTQKDVQRIQNGTAYLARMFLKHGAKRVVSMIQCSIREFHSLKDVEAFENLKLKPSQIETAAFHPLGTARMAISSDDGVVDENFKVFGFKGLYLCDGSVIPSSLGVNPQLTIMAFARMLARDVLLA